MREGERCGGEIGSVCSGRFQAAARKSIAFEDKDVENEKSLPLKCQKSKAMRLML